MKIAIFGLGYVGTVSAACLAELGQQVTGVDINPVKVDIINAGKSPIVEPNLDTLIAKNVSSGKLRATISVREAIWSSDLSFICVGTPSAPNGSLDLQYVQRVSSEIGDILREKKQYHTIVYRSTMLPGSVENLALPILEKSTGKRAGIDFGLVFNPEFLREGSAIADFHNPPRTVVGEWTPRCGDPVVDLYSNISAPLVRTNIRTAEMVKYADNAFHGLKIAFGNEIGTICRQVGVDSQQLMQIFCLDTKLNLSPVYLKPGNAFGGSCLPKDLRAITHLAQTCDLAVPVLDGILLSNQEHKNRALGLVMAQGKKKIGVLGLSFKEDTDDLRESSTVELLERLIGKGYTVCIYDRNVSLARLMGANKLYIEQELPHISTLMVDSVETVLEKSEVIVIANRSTEFVEIPAKLKPDQKIVDLIRLFKPEDFLEGQYQSLVG